MRAEGVYQCRILAILAHVTVNTEKRYKNFRFRKSAQCATAPSKLNSPDKMEKKNDHIPSPLNCWKLENERP